MLKKIMFLSLSLATVSIVAMSDDVGAKPVEWIKERDYMFLCPNRLTRLEDGGLLIGLSFNDSTTVAEIIRAGGYEDASGCELTLMPLTKTDVETAEDSNKKYIFKTILPALKRDANLKKAIASCNTRLFKLAYIQNCSEGQVAALFGQPAGEMPTGTE